MPWLRGLQPHREIFRSPGKLIFEENPQEKAGQRFYPASCCSFDAELVATGLCDCSREHCNQQENGENAKNQDCPKLGLSDSKSDQSHLTLNSLFPTGAKIGNRGKSKNCSGDNFGSLVSQAAASD